MIINGCNIFAFKLNFKSNWKDTLEPESFFSNDVLILVPLAGPEIISVINWLSLFFIWLACWTIFFLSNVIKTIVSSVIVSVSFFSIILTDLSWSGRYLGRFS